MRVEQVGQNSLEPRSGLFSRGFSGHTYGAEAFPGQIQDEGSARDRHNAEQEAELLHLRRQRQRQGDNRCIGDQRGQGDLAAFPWAMPQRLRQHQRQQGAGGEAAEESQENSRCQSRRHYGTS